MPTLTDFRHLPAAVVAVLMLLGAVSSRAQELSREAVRALPEYKNGVEAMADSLPGVAVDRFATLLDRELTAEAEKDVCELLAEAYVRNGRPADALAQLEAVSTELRDQRHAFWTGQAQLASGRYADAVESFAALLEGENADADLVARARLSQASLLHSLQQTDRALVVLDPLLESDDVAFQTTARLVSADLLIATERLDDAEDVLLSDDVELPDRQRARVDYFRARIALLKRDFIRARGLLAPLTEAQTPLLDKRFTLGALLGLAEAEIELGATDEALARVTAFIQKDANGPFLDQAFALLLRIALDAPATSRGIIDQLKAWSEDPAPAHLPGTTLAQALRYGPTPTASERVTFSLYTLSRILRDQEGQSATARHALNRLRLENAGHYLARLSLIETAYLLGRDGDLDSALGVLASVQEVAVSPRLKSIAGFLEAELAAGRASSPAELAAAYAEVATGAENDISEAAAFNAGLYALDAAADDLVKQMQARISSPEMRETLRLEIALSQRFQQSARSREALSAFIEESPDHPRIDEARLALAELLVTTSPTLPELAAAQVGKLNPGQISPVRLALVRIAIARLEGRSAEAAEVAAKFLEVNPEALDADRVRLAMGQAQFQEGNYYDAWTSLEALAKRENVEPAIRETALFIAAVSASRGATDPARESSIALFQQVVDLAGDLAPEASYELASQLLFFGRYDRAFAVLDELIAALPEQSPLYLRAITLAASAHLQLAPGSEKELNEAIRLYDQGLAKKGLSSAATEELMFLKAFALESVGRGDEAQAIYYAIVNREATGDGAPRTFRWFEKAGFRLIEQLEAEGRHRAVIAVARKIEAAGGPLSKEAKAKADQTALEHMLFDL